VQDTGKKARIQILNPFSDKTIEVSVIFHSRDIDRCEHKKVGRLYNEIVNDKSCYDFLLDTDNTNELEVYVSKR
jgi:hypothetical protein